MSGITGSGGVDPRLKADTVGGADPVGAGGGETGAGEVEGTAVVNQARMRSSAAAGQLALMARLLDAEDKATGAKAGTDAAPVSSLAAPVLAGTEPLTIGGIGPDGLIDLSKMPNIKPDTSREFTVDRETFLKAVEEKPEMVASELARLANMNDPDAYLEAMEWLRYRPNLAMKLLPSLTHVGGPGGGRLQADTILMLRPEAQDKADARNQVTNDALTKATASFLQSNPTGFLGYLEGRPSLNDAVAGVLKPVLEKGAGGEKIVGEALAAVATEASRAADAAGKAKNGSEEERTAIDAAQNLGQLLSHVEEAIGGVAGDAKAKIRSENNIMGYAMDAMQKVVGTVVPQASEATGVLFGKLKEQLASRLDDVDAQANQGRAAMVGLLLKTFEAVNDPKGSRAGRDPAYRSAFRIYKDNLTEGRKDTKELKQ